MLHPFLRVRDSVLWWGVLGEGGIGKSRLLLEWLKVLPANWYDFFAWKDPKCFSGFVPFTDTVHDLKFLLFQGLKTLISYLLSLCTSV